VPTDSIEHMFDDVAVRDLDTTQVLDRLVQRRRDADRAEAEILALAVHYVDLHPVVEDQPAAGWADRRPDPRFPRRRTDHTPDSALDQVPNPLAGDGTPDIAEFAVEELGAALNLGYHTALQLVSDAVELCYRLPHTWALVQAGDLQAYKARRAATETKSLSRAAVGFVDRHLAVAARHNRLPSCGPCSTRRCSRPTPTPRPGSSRPPSSTAASGSTTATPPPPPG
jgi:hypothetical protein